MTTTRDELRKLAENATPGPWEARECLPAHPGDFAVIYPDQGNDLIAAYVNDWCVTRPDAEFIAAARTALPALLDENEALWADLHTARDHLRQAMIEVRGGEEYAEMLHRRASRAEARIKAVQDVLDEPDAMIGTRLHVSTDRIRRALKA